MTEGILENSQVADVESFADNDDAPTALSQLLVDLIVHLLQRTGAFGNVDQQRHFAIRVCQTRRGGNVSDFASHRLHDQNRVCRAGAFVFLVGVLDGVHPVLGNGTVSGRVVDELEFAVADVIVNRLRHADRLDIQAFFRRHFGNFMRRIHRVVSAVIEEIPDVVGGKDVDDSVVVFVLPGFDFISTRSN